jgi:transposase
MAHLYKKVKKGREYFYIRETQRVYGKPTTINQVYLGTAEKVQALLEGQDEKAQQGFSPKEFGSIFVLNEIDRSLDLAGLVDEILPPKKRTKGPSLGELFFYAALNRAIDPKSKRKLAAWYDSTDIQRIRPVRLESLSSQNFWNHWDRVGEADLDEIVTRFFQRVQAHLPSRKEHLLLEVTSYSSTSPAAANAVPGGRRKGAKAPHQFRLALITERTTGVPVFYQTISRSLPEEEFLGEVLNNLLAKVEAMGVGVKDLTIIFGKGVESPASIELIDAREDLHFIISYPPDLFPELARVPLEKFYPFPCKLNRRLIAEGAAKDQILHYETQSSIWGRSRKVIVSFSPRVYQREHQEFQEKIERVRQEFLTLERKWRQGELPEDDPQSLQGYLLQICQHLQLRPNLFHLQFGSEGGRPVMSLQLREQEVAETVRCLGKTILITDHEDWDGVEICEAFVDQCLFEDKMRETGNTLEEVLLPQYHWTESKLWVNIFVCMAALTYLVLLCRRLTEAGLLATPKEVMAELRALRTAVFWQPEEEKLKRTLAAPTDTQLTILQALGFQVEEGRVLPLK